MFQREWIEGLAYKENQALENQKTRKSLENQRKSGIAETIQEADAFSVFLNKSVIDKSFNWLIHVHIHLC